MTTIKETVDAAFALARDAAKLRDAIARELPSLTGPDHAVAHRMYVVLTDLVVAFGHLEEWRRRAA